ncbi:MAG: hypothetical protein ACYDDF_04890 [Thermoplasmatota archaeon]
MAYRTRYDLDRSPGLYNLVGLLVLTGSILVLVGLGGFVAGAATYAGTSTYFNSFFTGTFGSKSTFVTTSITTIGVIMVALGILDFVAAAGLWGVRSWAWVLSLVVSIVTLLMFPLGTVLAVTALVYLSLRPVRDALRAERRHIEGTPRPGTPG